MSMNWKDALKEFNEKRKQDNEGAYIIPKRGTPEYLRVRKLMGNDEDLREWDATKINKNIIETGKAKRTESKSRTPPKKDPALEPVPEKKVVSEQNNKFKKTKAKKVPEPEPMSPEAPPEAEAEIKSKARSRKKKEKAFGDTDENFTLDLRI